MTCLLAMTDVQDRKGAESGPAPQDDLSASRDGMDDGLGEIVTYIGAVSTESGSYQN